MKSISCPFRLIHAQFHVGKPRQCIQRHRITKRKIIRCQNSPRNSSPLQLLQSLQQRRNASSGNKSNTDRKTIAFAQLVLNGRKYLLPILIIIVYKLWPIGQIGICVTVNKGCVKARLELYYLIVGHCDSFRGKFRKFLFYYKSRDTHLQGQSLACRSLPTIIRASLVGICFNPNRLDYGVIILYSPFSLQLQPYSPHWTKTPSQAP